MRFTTFIIKIISSAVPFSILKTDRLFVLMERDSLKIMKNNPLITLFTFVGIVHLIGEAMTHPVVYWTKPLLMPLLALWWYQQNPAGMLRTLIMAALLFSTLGDVLLMRAAQYVHYFLLGLAAFLVAHLFYIGAFFRLAKGQHGFVARHPWVLLFFLCYLSGLLYWLWPSIPMAMKGAVAVYALVISVMAVAALNLRGILPEKTGNRLFLGALLFVLSDSMIAINKFGHPFPASNVAIMATYILGQLAMVWALIKRGE